jgi:hypothetical protein
MKILKFFEQFTKYTLIDAINDNDINHVRKLVYVVNVNDKIYGMYPIVVAGYRGYSNIILELIKAGANINIQDNNEADTALIAACGNNHIDAAKILIKYNADINLQSNDGNSALHFAAINRNLKLVCLLIDSGADWNLLNINNKDFLDNLSDPNLIIQKYPDKYKNYIIKKEAQEYNI